MSQIENQCAAACQSPDPTEAAYSLVKQTITLAVGDAAVCRIDLPEIYWDLEYIMVQAAAAAIACVQLAEVAEADSRMLRALQALNSGCNYRGRLLPGWLSDAF
eukprot:s1152_g15.t1